MIDNQIWEKENDREPFFVVVRREIGLQPSFNYDSYSSLRRSIINNALKCLGSPYDTGEKGDGLSERNNQGEYILVDNNTGKKFILKLNKGQCPMVCIDVVVFALEASGFYIPLEGFDKRRTKVMLEKYFRNNINFDVIDPEIFCCPKTRKTDLSGHGLLPGDMVITQHDQKISGAYGWHIGIVESVDQNGFPLTFIHSPGHTGVLITTTMSYGCYQDHKTGRNRYDGFFFPGDRVWIVRIKE